MDKNESKEIREREIFDPRNITDEFKGKSNEDIIHTLEKRRSPLVAVLNNTIRDFNWGTVVRNANGFGVGQVIFCGKSWRDRRGAVGTQHYTNVTHADDLMETLQELRDAGYSLVAAENPTDRVTMDLQLHVWKEKSAVIFGEEGMTLPDAVLDFVDDIVSIPMCGSVRSLNVGVASGIFFNDYNQER